MISKEQALQDKDKRIKELEEEIEGFSGLKHRLFIKNKKLNAIKEIVKDFASGGKYQYYNLPIDMADEIKKVLDK